MTEEPTSRLITPIGCHFGMDERAALTHTCNRTFTDAQAADNLLAMMACL